MSYGEKPICVNCKYENQERGTSDHYQLENDTNSKGNEPASIWCTKQNRHIGMEYRQREWCSDFLHYNPKL